MKKTIILTIIGYFFTTLAVTLITYFPTVTIFSNINTILISIGITSSILYFIIGVLYATLKIPLKESKTAIQIMPIIDLTMLLLGGLLYFVFNNGFLIGINMFLNMSFSFIFIVVSKLENLWFIILFILLRDAAILTGYYIKKSM